jgi:hypothetical protein
MQFKFVIDSPKFVGYMTGWLISQDYLTPKGPINQLSMDQIISSTCIISTTLMGGSYVFRKIQNRFPKYGTALIAIPITYMMFNPILMNKLNMKETKNPHVFHYEYKEDYNDATLEEIQIVD